MQVQKARKGYKLVKSLFGKYEEIPEEWNLFKLNQVCKKISVGIATSTTKHFVEKGVPLLRNQNIKSGYIDASDLIFISKEFAKMNESKKLLEGDVVSMRTGYPGQSAVVPKIMEGWQTFTTLIFRPDAKILFSNYLSLFLNSFGRKQITSSQAGAAQQNLNAGWASNLLIILPSLSEQQKIASILSNVDSLIQITQKEIEQTQKLKKGLMQKLLTRGIGHTKFKKVKSLFGKYEEIPEEWNFKPLKEIGQIVGGGTPDSTICEYWDGDILWAVPTDVTGLSSNFIENTDRKITERGLNESSAKLLPSGTVLITSRATIGECAINTKPMATNQGFQSLICNEENDNLFIFYAIKFHKKRILRLSYGTTFLEISKNEIKKVAIPTPESIKEQQKIASILSNMDSLIQKQQEYKSKLELLKKGLMQKLLTGQIRVKV